MSYRSLLVHLDTDPLCAVRTQVAISIAKQLDCHLAGVAPTGMVDLPAAAGAAAALTEFAALAWETLREQAEQAVAQFRAACQRSGLKSFEAVTDVADRAPSLVQHAHCSDLVVLSQADPRAHGHRETQRSVEQVVLYSARPTLIVPYAGHFEHVGQRAMVAWDDSREAARALSDALPLLRNADSVEVVSWNEAGAGSDETLKARQQSLRLWLLWHGVSAEVRIESSDIGIAEALLSRAADAGTDLIVMGAYGHARWSERMLGGATRGLLTSMTVPVLMSH